MKVEDSMRRRKVKNQSPEKSFFKKGLSSIKGFISNNKSQKDQDIKAN
jgi:hypothetical protein